MHLGFLPLTGLAVLIGAVLILPLSSRKVEEELEAFLWAMGLIAVTVSGRWSLHLCGQALLEPVNITLAVLLAGFLFRLARPHLRRAADRLVGLVGLRATMAGAVFLLGVSSGAITAIIAALVLSEAAAALRLDRAGRTRFVVCACYAIGLGAALTPLGEPLSTIVVAKLKGPPHFADFTYLARLLGWWIVPGIALCAGLSAVKAQPSGAGPQALAEGAPETSGGVLLRAGKTYIFVMALVLLGAGLAPLAERTLAVAPGWAIFWLNSVSAVIDNATLAAAEIVPAMDARRIVFALLGMLISGGMLIPGNIPNIICAGKLGIRSREWAAAAVPMGLAMMAGCFALLLFL